MKDWLYWDHLDRTSSDVPSGLDRGYHPGGRVAHGRRTWLTGLKPQERRLDSRAGNTPRLRRLQLQLHLISTRLSSRWPCCPWTMDLADGLETTREKIGFQSWEYTATTTTTATANLNYHDIRASGHGDRIAHPLGAGSHFMFMGRRTSARQALRRPSSRQALSRSDSNPMPAPKLPGSSQAAKSHSQPQCSTLNDSSDDEIPVPVLADVIACLSGRVRRIARRGGERADAGNKEEGPAVMLSISLICFRRKGWGTGSVHAHDWSLW
jgi:hypothetical protein